MKQQNRPLVCLNKAQDQICNGMGINQNSIDWDNPDNAGLLQTVSTQAQQLEADPDFQNSWLVNTPTVDSSVAKYATTTVVMAGVILVLVDGKWAKIADASGMNNVRVLNNITIKGYRVSMDLERGGSGLTNIHIKVGDVKYVFDKEAGTFLNAAGDRLPNSLRDNQRIMKALEKALDLESKGW